MGMDLSAKVEVVAKREMGGCITGDSWGGWRKKTRGIIAIGAQEEWLEHDGSGVEHDD